MWNVIGLNSSPKLKETSFGRAVNTKLSTNIYSSFVDTWKILDWNSRTVIIYQLVIYVTTSQLFNRNLHILYVPLRTLGAMCLLIHLSFHCTSVCYSITFFLYGVKRALCLAQIYGPITSKVPKRIYFLTAYYRL